MRARNSHQRIRDDREFPIRIRVKLPPDASKGLKEFIPFWLQANFGRESFAYRRMTTDAGLREMFYFRQLADAQAFMAAFPELELDVATTSGTDPSPMVPWGRTG